MKPKITAWWIEIIKSVVREEQEIQAMGFKKATGRLQRQEDYIEYRSQEMKQRE